ncbi:hypothetical protein ACWDHW_35025 [Streptomyces melanosporofaciens]
MIAGVACTDDTGALDPRSSQRLAASVSSAVSWCVPSTLGGAMLKIMPPVTTSESELAEALAVFNAATDAV